MTAPPNHHTHGPARGRNIAVLLPCYNEEITIARVVADFRKALPTAHLYVFDNDSDDNTTAVAAEAGASVRRSTRRGKGNVVRHMFRDIDADVYVMADGDGTYPADQASELVRVLEESDADMVVGTRLEDHDRAAFRSLHLFGNRLISKLISALFSSRVTDVLSGYRALTRNFVQALFLKSEGFEIETEITLQALIRGRKVCEIPVRYGNRPPGSVSKLSTWSDGWRVLKLMFLIFVDYKPLVFFSFLSALCFLLGLAAGWAPVADYLQTQYVSHVPLALLAAALEILAVLFLGIGLILNAIRRFHMESHELVNRVLDKVTRPEPME